MTDTKVQNMVMRIVLGGKRILTGNRYPDLIPHCVIDIMLEYHMEIDKYETKCYYQFDTLNLQYSILRELLAVCHATLMEEFGKTDNIRDIHIEMTELTRIVNDRNDTLVNHVELDELLELGFRIRNTIGMYDRLRDTGGMYDIFEPMMLSNFDPRIPMYSGVHDNDIKSVTDIEF